MYRRTVLALSTGGLTATSGCLSWFGFGSSGDDNADGDSATADESDSENENEDDTQTDQEQPDDNDSSTDTSDTQNETQNENENENDTENDSDDRQPLPDEEDTEIDRDQYNQSESRETEDLPQDYVEIPREQVNVAQEGDTITVTGTIKNTSDEDIDFVDIEMIYLDDEQSNVGTDFTVVRDLGAGDTAEFSSQASLVNLQGDPAAVDFNPLPQNYV